MTDPEDSQRSIRVKRIAVNARVSGKVGEFLDDDVAGRRRKRARIFGTVLEAVDSKRYKVLFDNGSIEVCYSNSLKVESNSTLPPDLALPLPTPQEDGPPNTTQGPEAVPNNPEQESEDRETEEHLPIFNAGDDESVVEPDDSGENENNVPLPVGALPEVQDVEAPVEPSYHTQKQRAKDKIREMIGHTERVKSGNTTVLWTVVEQHDPPELLHRRKPDQPIGWRDITTLESQPKNSALSYIFLELLFPNRAAITTAVEKMNENMKSARDAKVKAFTPVEFLICLGLLIGSAEFEQQGKRCWILADHGGNKSNDDSFPSLVHHPNFDRYISYSRFKDFRRYAPSIWHDVDRNANDDPWWKFAAAVDQFNTIRQSKLCRSEWAIIDESMSAWRPRTTKLGGLPNISHVPRKPEPLGTEFKCVGDPESGCLLALEIQRGKEGMKHQQHNDEMGNTGGCTLRLMNKINEQTQYERCSGVKGDAWFGSIKNCANLKRHGYESILQVKQNDAFYPKQTINEALADAPGGVHIVLTGQYKGCNLICTGYRYSRKTILYFVMSDNAGSTLPGTPYEMKYTDCYGNLCARYVERPNFISNFFLDSNCIDAHNHVRQHELGLEKKWQTKDPYFRLMTSLIGMCVADAWKIASVHKLIDGRKENLCDEKRMGIRKFAGALGFQLINWASALLNDGLIGNISIDATDKDEVSEITKQTQSTLSTAESIKSIRSLIDANGMTHSLMKLPKKETEVSKRKGTLARACKICKEKNIRHDVTYYCFECGLQSNYCSPDIHNKVRDCFSEHVTRIKRILPKRRKRNE